MKNILVGQSGGPTAVINASLYGVIKEAEKNGITVYGMIHGIEGFGRGKVINLSDYERKEELELLKTTPASFLGSCRYKLPEDFDHLVYRELFQRFEDLDIGMVLYIGGNDSMDTVDKLGRYAEKISSDIRFIGVPKTIDNDLVMTDHTPGFGSAAKYVAATVRDIVWDAGVYEHPVVTIVELMGRNAGWITASSVLARTAFEKNPLLIYLPESSFSIEQFLEDVRSAQKESPSVVVCVSEGIKDETGKLICEYGAESTLDQFGHKMLAGCGKILEQAVKEKIGCKCRSIELNLPQRCAVSMLSATDVEEAEGAGRFAVRKALDGESRKMVSFCRNEPPYEITFCTTDVSQVCNKEKTFPQEWIVDGHDISADFLEYVMPLVQGEIMPRFQDGLPELLKPAYRG